MIDKESTTNLMDELSSARQLSMYLDKYEFGDNMYLSFTDYVESLFKEKGIKKSIVIRKINMTRSYAYEVFTGAKRPSREKTLLLAFGLSLDFKGTQRLLLSAKHNPLHPKDKRDSILIFAIINGHSLMDTNMLLDDFGEPILE